MPAMQRPTRRPAPKVTKAPKVDLYLPPYLNVGLLRTVLVATIGAAVVAVPPLLSDDIARQWLWPRPGLVVLSIVIFALAAIAALLRQQQFVISSHQRYEESRAEMLRHTERNLNRLYALLDISHMVGSNNTLQRVFDSVTETCGKVFECEMSSLMIHNTDTAELVVRSIGGKKARIEALGDSKPVGEGVAGYAAAHRRPLLLSPEDDIRQFSGAKTQKAYSAMVVPIFVGEALVGVLNVSQRSGQVNYNEEDLKALQVFAENVGARIRHVEERRILLRRIEMLEKQIPERAPTPAGPQA